MIEARMIVVGVDGSEGSLHALRWALGEARLRNEAVEVIHGWHVPYYADVTGMAANPSADMQESADAVLSNVMAAVANDADGVKLTNRCVVGSPAATLIDASEHADLLVVGRRGHGGFVSLVMGSVAQQVAAHAHCPVVIVAGE
jgi:nucleotide-binding universal stress UspA family protein